MDSFFSILGKYRVDPKQSFADNRLKGNYGQGRRKSDATNRKESHNDAQTSFNSSGLIAAYN